MKIRIMIVSNLYSYLPTVKPVITKNRPDKRVKQYITLDEFNSLRDEFKKMREEYDRKIENLTQIINLFEKPKEPLVEKMVVDEEVVKIEKKPEEKSQTPYLKFRTQNFETFKRIVLQNNPHIKDKRQLFSQIIEVAKEQWKRLDKKTREEYGDYEVRKSIPKPLKLNLWHKYFNKENACGNCYICTRDIHISDFEAGHVIPVARGGTNLIDNLRPICGICNKSMGTQNLEDFKTKYFKD
jgi:5-methylcytosine-specific restriction endonuclease McrA